MKAFTLLGAAALFFSPALAQEDLGHVTILPFPVPSGTPSGTPSSTPSVTPTPWPSGVPRPTGVFPTGSWPTPSSSGVPPPSSSPIFAFQRSHARQVRPIFV